MFEETLNYLQEAVVVFDKDERLIIFNEEYAELFESVESALVPGVTARELATEALFSGKSDFEAKKPITIGLIWNYPIFAPRRAGLVCGGPRMAAFTRLCIRGPAMAEQSSPGPTLRNSGDFSKH